MQDTRDIAKSAVSRTGLAALICGVSAGLSLAQSGEDNLAVGFVIDETMAPSSVQVAGCQFQEVAVSGTEFIFDCGPAQIYEITYTDIASGQARTLYGILQLRPEASPSRFAPLPVHMVAEYADTLAGALAGAAMLENGLAPLLDGEGDSPVPEAAADETVELGTLTLTWSDTLGTLIAETGPQPEILSQEDGIVTAQIVFPADARPAEITVTSDRNPACSATQALPSEPEEVPTEITLPCTEHRIEAPLGLDLSGPGCRQDNAGFYTCLMPEGESIRLTAPGWTGITVPVAETEGGFSREILGSLRPEIALAALQGAAARGNETGCAMQDLSLRVGAYCVSGTCQTVAEETRGDLFESDAMPDLASVGWTGEVLPEAVLLELVHDGTGAAAVLKQERFEIAGDFATRVERFATSADGIAEYPVVMPQTPDMYRLGRQLRFYSDADCRQSLPDKVLDLSNPGNIIPAVNQCSHYRLTDDGRPRSSCLPVRIDTETETALADPDTGRCGTRRLVVVVAENRSLNGAEGQSILESIEAHAARMRTSEDCIPVDIARSIEEDREVLLQSEDAFYIRGEDREPQRISMNFVNRSSEILRDFEWIYRTWNDRLGAVVIIGDGTRVRAADMIDSPAAMAWELKGISAHFVDLSGRDVCDTFERTLMFESCTQSAPASFGEDFERALALGLGALKEGK